LDRLLKVLGDRMQETVIAQFWPRRLSLGNFENSRHQSRLLRSISDGFRHFEAVRQSLEPVRGCAGGLGPTGARKQPSKRRRNLIIYVSELWLVEPKDGERLRIVRITSAVARQSHC